MTTCHRILGKQAHPKHASARVSGHDSTIDSRAAIDLAVLANSNCDGQRSIHHGDRQQRRERARDEHLFGRVVDLEMKVLELD